MELTKEQKLYVINETVRYYENFKGRFCKGICSILEGIIENDLEISLDSWHNENWISDHFPELYKHKPLRYGMWWFPAGEKAPRLKYCLKIKKLIE